MKLYLPVSENMHIRCEFTWSWTCSGGLLENNVTCEVWRHYSACISLAFTNQIYYSK